jgi:beta-exotoxin I transport system permease protein
VAHEATAIPRATMLRSVFAKTLRDQRKALAWWALGFAGAIVMYSSFWPSVRDNAAQFNEYLRNLPDFVRNLLGEVDYTTPEGYLQSELFSFLAPILLIVYTIGAGARAVAGEEEAGSLDLLLSVPIRRRRVLADKFTAMAAASLFLTAVMWLTVLAVGPLFDLRVGVGGFTAMSINTFLLGLVFGSLALAIGTATGRKALAIGVPGGLAVVTFIVNTLAPSVDWLEPFRLLSPFYYYSEGAPILNGIDPAHALVLTGISVICLGYALWAFDRRDLAA